MSIVLQLPLCSASAPRPAAMKVDSWPREIDGGEEKVMMYQPQLEAWEGVNRTDRNGAHALWTDFS